MAKATTTGLADQKRNMEESRVSAGWGPIAGGGGDGGQALYDVEVDVIIVEAKQTL